MYRELKGLHYWQGLSEDDIIKLQEWIKFNNVDLDTTELAVQDYSNFYKNKVDTMHDLFFNLFIIYLFIYLYLG